VWLDGLDVPLVGFLNATFFEGYAETRHSVTRPEGDSQARYGNGILPLDFVAPATSTPLLNYSYEGTRRSLGALMCAGDHDPCHGVKTSYINPLTGGHAMSTMGAFAQLLKSGFRGLPYRATDSTVYLAIEGKGRTMVDGEVLDWQAHDVFVVPSWKWHRHEAGAESVLFSFSDRPVQQKLGLWREERGG
jgi:gentisate 1,2-dioxygenase